LGGDLKLSSAPGGVGTIAEFSVVLTEEHDTAFEDNLLILRSTLDLDANEEPQFALQRSIFSNLTLHQPEIRESGK
jgi:hypothetical protein